MIKDFLNAVRAGDANEAKTWFQTIFYKQLANKMEDKRLEVSQNIGKELGGKINKTLAMDD